jgi:acid phosphatase
MTESGFCKIFSENEWLDYEYGKPCVTLQWSVETYEFVIIANDLNYHRSLGYGNEFAPILGMPWISASARLLNGQADTSATNSSAGKQHLFVSFTHREGAFSSNF